MIPAGFEPVLRELAPLRDRFAAAGHRLYLVGGTVRDLMVGDPMVGAADGGRADFDLDATTPALPAQVKALLKGWADALWTQGERFGTIGAMKRVTDPDTGHVFERIYEITTHRAESYDGLTRKPSVEFADDIAADLSRRDFTVNAMAIELTAGEPELVDPFHGADDLAARVLRTPLGPHVSFSDDPLRMLRAARFITRYRLEPTTELVAAVGEMAGRLAIVSAERIQAEMAKLLSAPDPTAGLEFLIDSGVGRYVVPELVDLERSARDAAFRSVCAVPAERDWLRTAALLEPVGAGAAVARLRAWKSSNADIDAVGAVLRGVARWQPLLDSDAAWTDPQVRRLLHEARGHADDLMVLTRAVALAHDRLHHVTRLDQLSARVAELAAREPLDDLSPELDGDEVMRLLALTPGREVGEALAHLQQLRLDEGVLGRDEVSERVRRWWRNRA